MKFGRLLSLLVLLVPLTASANTYKVDNTNDWFWGSLRQAIEDANNHPGLDIITFAIGNGPKTIKLDTPLPIITDSVIIDGWTQPGWSGNPIIEIDGSKVFNGSGLRIAAPSTVRGLVINRFGLHGIGIGNDPNGRNGHGTVIHGCWIGVGLDGTTNRGNVRDGITVYANDVQIGGDTPIQRNVIAANGRNGITIGRHFSSDGNRSTSVGHRTRVRGNFIGVDFTGNTARRNWQIGVEILSGADSVIGGDTQSSGNVISGNGSDGVKINAWEIGTSQFIYRNTVKNNKIGTGVSGGAIGNGSANGVFPGVAVHTLMSTIAQNVIAYNSGAGIFVSTKSANLISSNSIYSNGRPGIDLTSSTSGSGVTLNDHYDSDAGGNGLLNFPVITAAFPEALHTRANGHYQGASSQTFTLEFFLSNACSVYGHGEGVQLIGTTTITTNATGSAQFSVILQPQATVGQVITATARDWEGSTSEFSECRTVTPGLGVSGISPAGGRPGTTVTINGTNFSNVTSVRFFDGYNNNINASFNIVSDNTLTTVVPAGSRRGAILVSTATSSAFTTSFRVTPITGDLSGDNVPDLVWRNYRTGENFVWVTGRSVDPLPAYTDLNWQVQGTADFNNDGYHDILWRNYASGTSAIWLLNGTVPVASTGVNSIGDPNWHTEAIGDFDYDGDPDLVWRNRATGAGSIWLMNGTAWTGAQVPLNNSLGVDWRIEAAGDFDLNGSTDLLWRNYATGENLIWLMLGASLESTAWLPTRVDVNWTMEAAVDWDQDGDLDIVWRNPVTGQNEVWLMIGANYNGISTISLNPLVDSDVRIEDY